jgi:TRAP-type C4-dicarboxylate transport system permease small subunit
MKAALALLRAACAGVFLLLVTCVLWGWITRELGNQARWSEELARMLLVWLSLLGAALAYAERAHLGIDLLTNRFDATTARWSEILVHGLTAIFALLLLMGGGGALFWERWESGQVLPALQIRKAWLYAAAPVSGAAILVFALDLLRATVRTAGARSKEETL